MLTEPALIGSAHPGEPRWQPGERLELLFEQQCDRLRQSGRAGQLAVDTGETTLTYDELDSQANRLARRLRALGARPGERIALLVDRPRHAYAGMLAVLKLGAAYVPLDVAFPADRLAFILADAGATWALTLSTTRELLSDVDGVEVVCVDELDLAGEDGARLSPAERGDPVDDLCYLIYTSGTTGRPKGVAIEHASICNFVRVAAGLYGLSPADRVYQGMTLAFDFSVEEIWVPWLAGATLVPKPAGGSLLGAELWQFLHDRSVTALCCVPTLLSTVDEDLPGLRFLLVSGEACPPELIERWHRPDRRFLNVYGPTEATVTATWSVVHPERPVTLGVPLPTYSVVILDPEQPRALPHGEAGEIGIAGIGLARCYLNRPELTARAFIPDFLGLPGNPSGRIYRTGDLGRINADGEIEYHGRIDTQVKIRGYRIELAEIESVLARAPGVAQAVVDTYRPEPGVVELVGYYRPRADAETVDQQAVRAHLRDRLPAYMVPAYLEQLDTIPMTASDKADRRNLPPPSGPRALAATGEHVPPATPTEELLADTLAEVLRVEKVSTSHHFFDDLGADSLLLARFRGRLAELAAVSMRDIYLHPTVSALAALLDAADPAPAAAPEPVPAPRGSSLRYALCGFAQLLFFLAYTYLNALVLSTGLDVVGEGQTLAETYLLAVAVTGGGFLALSLLPIAAKWVLVGRYRPGEFPLWGLGYLRFWVVKTLLRANPLVLFAGSPVYSLYLRLLGARIGRRVAVFSRNVPACPDLLTIGEGTVIRKDSFFTCHRVRAGMIETGPVTIGADAVISEGTVLDIGSTMGDRAQLGHASSLHTGQSIPEDEHWHGSPAEPSTVDYLAVAPARCGRVRRTLFGLAQLLTMLALTLPFTLLVLDLWLPALLPSTDAPLGSTAFLLGHLGTASAVFFGGALAGLLLVTTLPRLLHRMIKPDTVYPLYGLRYSLQRSVSRLTNLRFYHTLFGDSSYITTYLRALGYDLGRVIQSGSNFGVMQKHESPYLTTIGRGTMVSDGLSAMNAEFSSTSFKMARATLGEHNFLGNVIFYPWRSRTGDNCLLATKVLVPVDGPVRENTGLLGSPPFEIPRSVDRDRQFDHLRTEEELNRRLPRKNRHNLLTMTLYLLTLWCHFAVVSLLGVLGVELRPVFGELALATASVTAVAFSVTYFILVERASLGFRRLRPRLCSIYQPQFWQHERFWKLSPGTYYRLFNGTAFKGLIWRLLGARVGKRLYDDGCAAPEKSLVTLGDDTVLNVGSTIQGHSLEDGTFKSDHIVLGSGCTVSTGGFVHYGVSIGDGAVVEADAFVMKGEQLPAGARWWGNPAGPKPAASAGRSAVGPQAR
ncbi:amino acid adenylation domain-containing protein [Crossiella sp. CA-258035]|uniref:Pls/PosA family non-ribosomal peptide synthetase n=1 Tax=Crossiella sp. CA-258035 TaxID=2981138 RepID=UPI0024BC53AA|nr:Pls/PosA family non-ribosomal peptide synthetase [Crossiella sp. CA-258035]WHT17802.1 amino acid adenylation domain-containing protein [Crossiella sp. CA-258035]